MVVTLSLTQIVHLLSKAIVEIFSTIEDMKLKPTEIEKTRDVGYC